MTGLPPGLTLDQATGIISGTPTAPGFYDYSIQVLDSNGDCASTICQITVAPAAASSLPATSSTGRGNPPINYNGFDICLLNDYLQYKEIDPQLLQCAKKPLCFCYDERDWGEWGEAEEVPLGPPGGSIPFNPQAAISLPDPASGDVTILTEFVPLGYDGIITGQFNSYITNPQRSSTNPFVEGSGDLEWRLVIDTRYARDCGRIITTLGSSRELSPIAGGIQVRSGNRIRYVVRNVNLSGSMAAGLGSVAAGLHGFWIPRR